MGRPCVQQPSTCGSYPGGAATVVVRQKARASPAARTVQSAQTVQTSAADPPDTRITPRRPCNADARSTRRSLVRFGLHPLAGVALADASHARDIACRLFASSRATPPHRPRTPLPRRRRRGRRRRSTPPPIAARGARGRRRVARRRGRRARPRASRRADTRGRLPPRRPRDRASAPSRRRAGRRRRARRGTSRPRAPSAVAEATRLRVGERGSLGVAGRPVGQRQRPPELPAGARVAEIAPARERRRGAGEVARVPVAAGVEEQPDLQARVPLPGQASALGPSRSAPARTGRRGRRCRPDRRAPGHRRRKRRPRRRRTRAAAS